MIDGWVLWLLLVGLAVGAAGGAMLFARLPRQDDDLGLAERQTEAVWISATIERHGGIAPTSLVEEVLELHGSYLATPRPPAPLGATAPPLVPYQPGPLVPPGPPGSYPLPAPPPGYAPPPPGHIPPPGYAPSAPAGPPPGPPPGSPPPNG